MSKTMNVPHSTKGGSTVDVAMDSEDVHGTATTPAPPCPAESPPKGGLARSGPPKVAVLKSHPAPPNGGLAGWRAKPA
ncbi:hypothetical protein PIB30_035098 [Stylosanthes scabra]|uniref:Uncharacterized protein n=1 Tax=Stylosanthes scabra TaxID=79078 RepID=A0ABU6RDU9_9FABA|nr:hypothetical protein [Stylosanthes scabra]